MSGGATLDAGHVTVAATIVAGRIASVSVTSTRPRGLASMFVGRAPAEIPTMARRLFALCGMAQATAARQALRAAGAAIDGPDAEAEHDALVAERIAEHLRATVIGWAAAVPLTPEERPAVPAALAAVSGARIDASALPPALAALGLAGPRPPGSWADRLLRFAGSLPRLSATPPDPLRAADDAAVVTALDRGGDTFAARPALPGRTPQTGAAARAALAGRPATQPEERLAARLDEIAAAAAHLSGTRRIDESLVVAGRLDTGLGFAAVETPRGRLHHLVGLDRAGAIGRYLIVAPTEWNFSPEGPCATALRGASIDAGAAADTIARLASLYDPCVECRIEIGTPAGMTATTEETV